MSFEYQFPKYTKTKVSIGNQIQKINEEAREVALATDLHEVILETLDVIQAAETLLRSCDQEEVQKTFVEVINKNEERGYYKCPSE